MKYYVQFTLVYIFFIYSRSHNHYAEGSGNKKLDEKKVVRSIFTSRMAKVFSHGTELDPGKLCYFLAASLYPSFFATSAGRKCV